MASDVRVDREQVLAFRWRAHQLGREPGSGSVADTALLDFGVQDTGPRGARWALANVGRSRTTAPTCCSPGPCGPPHTSTGAPTWPRSWWPPPRSTRPTPASGSTTRPGRCAWAGIPVLDALAVIAEQQRAIVTAPMDKGTLSTALTARLDAPYLRRCEPCQATHAWESPFRMAALQGGLELRARDVAPGAAPDPACSQPRLFGTSGTEAAPRFDVVRNYLRFFGPARPRDAAAFLDAPAKEVIAHWPEDVVPVQVTGTTGSWSVLAGDVDALVAAAAPGPAPVRLLGPYDAWLQLRDRDTLLPDRVRARDVWRTIGRPGAVVRGGEVIGTWRPRSAGSRLTVTWEPWVRATSALRAAVAEQAERLASVREQALAGVEEP